MKARTLTATSVITVLGVAGGITVACDSDLPTGEIVDGPVDETGATEDGGTDDPGTGDGDGTSVNETVLYDAGVTLTEPAADSCGSDPLARRRTLKPEGTTHEAADLALRTMTLQEKMDMLHGGVPCPDTWDCDFDATGVPSLGIKDFRLRDGPRGVHTHNGTKATTFAVAMARGASFDVNLEQRVGEIQGVEMEELKYDLSLAPQINTLRHPRWARAQESYSEDPFMLGKFGAAYVLGMQERIPACPKHFAGNNTDENRQSMSANMDEQTLRENYSLAFKIVVEDSDPACIMAAYNQFNGVPSTEQEHLLVDILRDDWDWEGFVVSDWWATTPDEGAATLNGGTDLEMPDSEAFGTLQDDLDAQRVNSNRIDSAAERILNVRGRFGQLDEGYSHDNPNFGIVDNQAHKDLARETAEKGAVLLENNGVLPIDTSSVTSILVMGPDANLPNTATTESGIPHGMGDRGSSNTNPPYAVSYAAGITARAEMAGITVSTSNNPADAEGVDLVIIPVTMQHEDEGEAFDNGGDRDDMTFGGNHPIHWAPKPTTFINDVASYNSNVVVLEAVGSAIIDDGWVDNVAAVVQTFYPGQEAGTAVANLLFGDINFFGRLPFTVATDESHYPYFGNNDSSVEFDYLHGYRKFEAEGITPKYWFGYGLSYTTFEFSDLTLLCDSSSTEGAINAAVTVTNTGSVPGDEVVQAYVGYPNTGARRPPKELKAFGRTGTIAPGESQTVYISIPARDLQYWADGGWTLENVEHSLIVSPTADPADPQMQSLPFTLN